MKLSVVVACHGECPELGILLQCLRYQRRYDVGKHSVTGEDCLWYAYERAKHEVEIICTSDGRFDGLCPGAHLIEVPQENNCHAGRAAGIEAATGDWIVLTNSDNYYVNGFVDSLTKAITPNLGLVYWDLISNLWQWTGLDGTRLERWHVDLGCVAVRTEIAKRVGFPWRHYDADWDYIERCASTAFEFGLKSKKISQTLCVHN